MIVACIPAYNAQRTIADVIVRTKKFVDKILVYDDGSIDHTFQIAWELGAITLREERNRGKGYALKKLFEAVKKLKEKPDVIVTLDADGQHYPEDIPELTQPILDKQADVTVGLRKRSSIPFHRFVGNKFLDLFSSSETKETQSGFRAYSYETLEGINVKVEGYGSDTQILLDLKEKDKRVVYVPIQIKYDEESHKRNPIIQFYQIFRFLFLKEPLRNLGLLGFAGFILGMIVMVNVIVVWSTTLELALGTLFLAMTLLLLGALTFFVGVILHVIKGELQ